MEQPVYFGMAFEGLYLKALAGRIDAGLTAELHRLGLDLGKPILPAYSVEVWEACLERTAKALYGELSPNQAMERLGVDYMKGFEHTLVGSAVVALGRIIGTERTLQRFSRNARTTSNIYLSETKTLAPGHLEMHTSLEPSFVGRVRPMSPPNAYFLNGVVVGIFGVLEVEPERVELRIADLPTHHTVIDIRWKA